MINNFEKDGKSYDLRQNTSSWSQWQCTHEDGLTTWAAIYKKNPTRQDVIDAIDNVDLRHADEEMNY